MISRMCSNPLISPKNLYPPGTPEDCCGKFREAILRPPCDLKLPSRTRGSQGGNRGNRAELGPDTAVDDLDDAVAAARQFQVVRHQQETRAADAVDLAH